MSENKKIYFVHVYNDNGMKSYKTYVENVFYNYNYGNTATVIFSTIDDVQVSLPPSQVIIEQELIK